MHRQAKQLKLVDEPRSLPNGLVYRPDFLSPSEEEGILRIIKSTHLRPAPFREYLAKRRICYFEPLPEFLKPLGAKIAKWLNLSKERVTNALVTEYRPGTPIGWHRDKEICEHIVGVSLAGWCVMQFRPEAEHWKQNVLKIELEPRSAYIIQKEIRNRWQHHIPPTKTLRYSITFRTQASCNMA